MQAENNTLQYATFHWNKIIYTWIQWYVSSKETKDDLIKTRSKLKDAKDETEQIRRDCQAIIKTYQVLTQLITLTKVNYNWGVNYLGFVSFIINFIPKSNSTRWTKGWSFLFINSFNKRLLWYWVIDWFLGIGKNQIQQAS